ncbi:recombinase family protein [Gimesia maris]|uniref:recombinase family protein n=1 Tax=Gimesia maris TaxID=122 RepID=UPI0030D93381|tara:strand:- start:104409 stop:106370 length:1962 start_codon:yes stop_codon:yes gene_type:complete
MANKLTDRGVGYYRDSGGKHETTPSEYVLWTSRAAKQHNVTFNGSPDQIDRMIRKGLPVDGDIYLDYGVSGNKLSRPALDQLFIDAISDPSITHLFIPKRNRLARPDHPLQGVELENRFRSAGITIVYQDRVLPALSKGKSHDIGDIITAVVDYHQSGTFRRELGKAMIYAQTMLAKAGFTSGGRAPFGFRRWLAKLDGTVIRQLENSEYVRMQGHHVVWLPGPQEEIELALRIRQMLLTIPASQIAAILNAEEIPSPDAGRTRTDNGVKHRVSGLWHQSTVVNIGRNPLFMAVARYGVRSMGDQVRLSPEGPRDLEETDYDSYTKKPKVIRNAESTLITAPAHFEPIETPADHEKLVNILNQRAGTQRGKSRSRNPAMNPLGCRVFDMNCGSTMYRAPEGRTYRYSCGLYLQSHGQKCAHNKINGPMAARFGLSCIRQKLSSPAAQEKLRQRLEKLAQQQPADNQLAHEVEQKQTELNSVIQELKTVSNNLARAKTDDQYTATAKVFDQVQEKQKQLEEELDLLKRKAEPVGSIDSEVDQVMQLVGRLTELAEQSEDFSKAKEIFDLTDLRMFLRFEPKKLTKRTVNKLVGGVVVFGGAEPPVKLYQGPTATSKLKEKPQKALKRKRNTNQNDLPSGREDKSLRNVSRDDRI